MLFVDRKNYVEVKSTLLKDDTVSRASIIFREASTLGFDRDGYYCYVSGSEEACNRARELVKGLATVMEEGGEVVKRIKKEEKSAIEGFGNIFG